MLVLFATFRENYVFEKPASPRSIGGVLDDGIQLWKQALAKTWLLAVISRIIIAIPSIFFRTQVQDAASLPLNERLLAMMGQSSRYSLWVILLLVVSYSFHNAIQLRVAAEAEHSPLTFGEALSKGIRLLPRLIWLLVLLFLAIFVIGVIFALVVQVGLFHLNRTAVLAFTFTLVFLLAFIPLIRLVMGYIYMTVEDQPAFTSLKASWTLTRGYWWRVATILTVMAIIALVLAAVMYMIGGAAAGILGAFSLGTAILIQVVSVMLTGVLGSFYPSLLYATYLDLKLRNEGADLAGRVNALAVR